MNDTSDTSPITEFQGRYRFLSNFWPSIVCLDSVSYPTVEHAYQAAKTFDRNWRNHIRSAPTPGNAKKRARDIPPEHQWRSFSAVKIEIMRDLLRQKFAHAELKHKLLNTGDRELIEGNTWGDAFWGVCRGKGQNRLGKLLMNVRAEIVARER